MNFSSALTILVLVLLVIVAVVYWVFCYAHGIELRDKILIINTVVVSAFSLPALLVSLYSLHLSRKDRFSDIKMSRTDDFWFRTVLFPGFYGPFKQLLTDFKNTFDKNPYDLDMEKFSSDIHALSLATDQFEIIDKQFVPSMNHILDKIESRVSIEYSIAHGDSVAEIDRSEEMSFDDFRTSVLKELHDLHKRVGLDADME